MLRISFTEHLSLLGMPARVLGRLPLLVRYAYRLNRQPNEYAKDRCAGRYMIRPGLWLDIPELEALEDVMHGTPGELEAFRKSRLDTASTTGAVVSSKTARAMSRLPAEWNL